MQSYIVEVYLGISAKGKMNWRFVYGLLMKLPYGADSFRTY